jgi:hypothetical protein
MRNNMVSTAKINRLVRRAIPKGKPAKIIWYPTGFSKAQVLRVITPAWRNLPRFERIHKVHEAIQPHLSPKERDHIFRISVLTTQEFNHLRMMLPPHSVVPARKRNGHSRRAKL